MKFVFLIFCCLSASYLSAQDKDKIAEKGKKIFPEEKLPQLDTTKHRQFPDDVVTKWFGPVTRKDTSIDIPTVKPDPSVVYSGKLKYASGKESVVMPGTEALDSLQRKDSISRGIRIIPAK